MNYHKTPVNNSKQPPWLRQFSNLIYTGSFVSNVTTWTWIWRLFLHAPHHFSAKGCPQRWPSSCWLCNEFCPFHPSGLSRLLSVLID